MGLLRCTRGVWGRAQPWRLGVTAGQLTAGLLATLPFAFACEWGCARGIPPPRESPPGPHSEALLPFHLPKIQIQEIGSATAEGNNEEKSWKMKRSAGAQAASATLGWLYFCCWSLSFYPQMLINYQRKSVVGLSLDFQALNLLGYCCYSIYTACLIYNKPIEEDYRDAFGSSSLVTTQDCFFALHGAFITSLTVLQCAIYDRGGQSVSTTTVAGIGVTIVGTALYSLLILFIGAGAGDSDDDGDDDDHESNSKVPLLSFLALIYWLSVIKLATVVCKYVPQAHFNYVNKSTVGWSIGNILLDFSGGVLSLAQLFLDGATLGWSGVAGNPIKFALGFVSIIFDVLFMVQHYCLYTDRTDKALLRRRQEIEKLEHERGDHDNLRRTLIEPIERAESHGRDESIGINPLASSIMVK